MIKVASAPLDMDLGRFSAWLLSQGVYHRIVEEAGEQWVLMREDADHDAVREVFTRYLSEPAFQQQLDAQPMGPWRLRNSLVSVMPRASWREAPVMYLVLAFALLVGLLTGFGDGGPLLRALLIIDPFQVDHALRSTDQRLSGLMLMLQEGQLWRLVSPDFLHFSIPHFIFNALMIWYLGGQLEARKGSIYWVVFFIAVSLTANIAQLFDAGALFGG